MDIDIDERLDLIDSKISNIEKKMEVQMQIFDAFRRIITNLDNKIKGLCRNRSDSNSPSRPPRLIGISSDGKRRWASSTNIKMPGSPSPISADEEPEHF